MNRKSLWVLPFLLLGSTPLILQCSSAGRQSPPQTVDSPETLPDSLPFEFTREDVGEPVSPEEVSAFTWRIVEAWRRADFFHYLQGIVYGVPRNNPQGMPYYSVYWSGVAPYKEGDLVTFRHLEGGSAENIMIPNPVLLTNVIAAYKFAGDERLALLADELARGVSAQFMGCVWDRGVSAEDRHVMARAVINNNFEAVRADGRRYAADYSAWRILDMRRWNTWFINIPNNPYWGDVYIQNMRSKDDVCHLFRAGGLLPHFLNLFPDPEVRAGVSGAFHDLAAFAKDITDHGFRIRSVDLDGNIWIPGIDLASFVFYGQQSECDAVLAARLLGYGDPGEIDCGNGISSLYETVATSTHTYNYNIIRNFHMAALLASLNHRYDEVALRLMEGLAERSTSEMGKTEGTFADPGEQENFNGDLAGNLAKYAACGLPLTSREVRHLHRYYDEAAEVWNSWGEWNLWDASVPDGRHAYTPGTRVDFQDMTAFLQLCASPFVNDAGAAAVDCEIIRDAANWGY